jgi:hypothetical protein
MQLTLGLALDWWRISNEALDHIALLWLVLTVAATLSAYMLLQ